MRSLIFVILVSFVGESSAADSAESQVALANDQFGIDLLKELSKQYTDDNVFFSPMSISAALAMLSLGAIGQTLDEINKACHFNDVISSDPMAVHKVFEKIITEYETTNSNYSLSLASRLYASKDYKIKEKYLEETKEYYHATVENVDFSSGGAEEIINQWVSEQTNGKIQNLFPPGSLSADTILALVNAIYFKGKWMKQFNEKDTHDMDFYVSRTETKTVNMMSIESVQFLYTEDPELKIQVLQMPYDGDNLSMTIILPKKDGLSKLISRLDAKKLRLLLKGMTSREVDVKFPRFKLETKYSLNEQLEKLGINDAFSSKANLSGIGDGRLEISEVTHKAYVEVNEEGTEAAAATGIFVYASAVINEPPVIEFTVNSAFLFMINHKDEMLFMGKVISP